MLVELGRMTASSPVRRDALWSAVGRGRRARGPAAHAQMRPSSGRHSAGSGRLSVKPGAGGACCSNWFEWPPAYPSCAAPSEARSVGALVEVGAPADLPNNGSHQPSGLPRDCGGTGRGPGREWVCQSSQFERPAVHPSNDSPSATRSTAAVSSVLEGVCETARARSTATQPRSSRFFRAFSPRFRFLLSARSRISWASAFSKNSGQPSAWQTSCSAISSSMSLGRFERADDGAPLREVGNADSQAASAAVESAAFGSQVSRHIRAAPGRSGHRFVHTIGSNQAVGNCFLSTSRRRRNAPAGCRDPG